jgi:NAD(P)-dependent dehydrogenase (short-subunit alcohol dehydrogenase family)
VVNNASLFDYDSADDFSMASWTPTCAPTSAPAAAGASPARGHAGRPAGRVINLLDQKLYNLNPDFLSYTLSKAALHTATTMLAQRWRRSCGWSASRRA